MDRDPIVRNGENTPWRRRNKKDQKVDMMRTMRKTRDKDKHDVQYEIAAR